MMAKGFAEFKERVLGDKELAAKVKALKSVEAAVELGKQEGYAFTASDVKDNSKLSKEELASLSIVGDWAMAKAWFLQRD
jgi:predicted ribosomally synthesized peptide with nif11-like leader